MKWNIGSEYEEILFNKLGEALVKLGFNLSTNWTGVGGSQEISRWEVESNEGKLIIQAQTYVGLTIERPEEIVNKVKNGF